MKCLKVIFAIISAVALLGCGGSGTTTANFTALSVLSNGQGVARGVTSDGRQALVFTSGVRDFVSGANEAGNGGVSDASTSDLPITYKNGNVEVRTGTGSSGGYTWNIASLENKAVPDAAAIYMETPGYADTLAVTGAKFTSSPIVGTYLYTGTQTSNARSVIAPGSIGTFQMYINFGSEDFSYNGNSGGVSVSGSGAVDVKNGRFATSGLTIKKGYTTYGGTMHGLLHGTNARSTSGVFHTSDYAPDYSGTFLGSK